MGQPEFPAESGAYPEPSQASTVLVLGILGILFQVVAPFAWIMGTRELAAIDDGRRNPENRESANTGRVLGIIGTVLLTIGLIFIVLILTDRIDVEPNLP